MSDLNSVHAFNYISPDGRFSTRYRRSWVTAGAWTVTVSDRRGHELSRQDLPEASARNAFDGPGRCDVERFSRWRPEAPRPWA